MLAITLKLGGLLCTFTSAIINIQMCNIKVAKCNDYIELTLGQSHDYIRIY